MGKKQKLNQIKISNKLIKQQKLSLKLICHHSQIGNMFLKKSISSGLLMSRQSFLFGSNPVGSNIKKSPYVSPTGVNRNASEKQIKTAYYKLAREYHPDVNTQNNAHSRFSQINMAYENMINSMAQAAKDQKQKTSTQSKTKQSKANEYTKNYEKAKQQRSKPQPPPEEEFQEMTEEDFNQFEKAFRSFINKGKIDPKHKAYSRFFSQFFTSQDPDELFGEENETDDENFMSSRDLKIVTINAKLNITPEEALNGITKVLFQITKNILYRKTVLCGSCHGKSSEAKKIKCKKCSGSGFVGKGLDDIRCCSACNGNGTVRNQGCKECRGKGNVEIYAEEAVRVPAHSLQNQEIVLKGRGNQHPKKFYYGDVYIKLKISNKPLIKVDGMNTFSEVKLSISEAILGAKIEYPTLKGNKNYEVQKGMADNEEVVIRGEGLKKGNKIGDHYLKLKIHIPKSVSKQEEEIFMKLRDIEKRKSKSSHK